MTAQPQWSPVDDSTADLLTLVHSNWLPFAESDRNAIANAIRDDARMHGGEVSSNRVRDALAALPVLEQPKPQRVGPVYRALCLFGELRVDGWETSLDSHGKNAGKPARKYLWIGESA